MRNYEITALVLVVAVCLVGPLGCEAPTSNQPTPKAQSGETIGSVVEVFAVPTIQVEGYTLVVGLEGTGSSQCPPQIREHLRQYILSQLPDDRMDIDALISSRDTAVVLVSGTMPTAVEKGEHFDLVVEALAGTQTISLEGGRVLGADLKQKGTFRISTKTLADAEGDVYIDTITPEAQDKRRGLILAGGTVRDNYRITMGLRTPDFVMARRITDMINMRFGIATAAARSQELIELGIPAIYRDNKARFVMLLQSMYLDQDLDKTEQRVNFHIEQLVASQDKEPAEIALEAIGNAGLVKLQTLLASPDEEVRFRAARCMLNLGSSRSLETLRTIAFSPASMFRTEALEAVTVAANPGDASALARRLLQDGDFKVRLSAYEQLRKLDDIALSTAALDGKLLIEQITGPGPKEIYVTRSGRPTIVLFGAPMECRPDVFIQSPNAQVTINAVPGSGEVSLIRKVPGLPNAVEFKTSHRITEIIRVLCQKPVKVGSRKMIPGLNVSYDQTIAILKQMCERGALPATFRAGPMPQFEQTTQ